MGINLSKSVAVMLVLVFLTASCVVMPLPVKAGSKTITVPDDYPTISEAIKNADNGRLYSYRGNIREEVARAIQSSLLSIQPQKIHMACLIIANVSFITQPEDIICLIRRVEEN